MPQRTVAMPQSTLAMPQRTLAMPQPALAMSQRMFAMPQPMLAMPQRLIAMPQPTLAMPQRTLAMPQRMVATLPRMVAIPPSKIAMPQSAIPISQKFAKPGRQVRSAGPIRYGMAQTRLSVPQLMPRISQYLTATGLLGLAVGRTQQPSHRYAAGGAGSGVPVNWRCAIAAMPIRPPIPIDSTAVDGTIIIAPFSLRPS